MPRYNPKQDENDFDLENTRTLTVWRWKEMVNAACDSLTSIVDRQTVQEPRDWKTVAEDIREKASDQTCSVSMRRTLLGLVSLPMSLANITSSFTDVLAPYTIELKVLWGLLFLNVKVSNWIIN
jgi:hypothetical protein